MVLILVYPPICCLVRNAGSPRWGVVDSLIVLIRYVAGMVGLFAIAAGH